MDTLLQDVRYGARMLFKNLGFTITAVLTLALAIGANTAIFSVVNALLLKMLPVEHADSLVVVGNPTRVHSRSGGTPSVDIFSYPLFKEIRDQNQVFSSMFATGDTRRLRITTGTPGKETEEPIRGRIIAGDYFGTLGVRAVLGRGFLPQETEPGTPSPVVVISHTYWQRKFDSNPSIVGQTIRLNSTPFTVVGVLQPGFDGEVSGELLDVWLPMSMQPQILPGDTWVKSPNVSWLVTVARLKPGVTRAQAEASVNVLFQQLARGPYGATLSFDDSEEIKKYTIKVVPGGKGLSWARQEFSQAMMLLLGIVGLVLLIACTNVSNMLLARSSARRKEVALRLALGASPGRVMRQLLTESVLLAALGGLVGILVAQWGTQLLLHWVGQQYTRLVLDTSMDARVLGFTVALCVLTGVLFGLVPAIKALRTEVTPSLESSRMSAAAGRGLFSPGNLLIAGQLAISVLVLLVCGLLVRSLHNLQGLDFGYSREGLVAVRTDPMATGYSTERLQNLAREIGEGIATIPGVSGVAYSENGLFSGSENGTGIVVEGFEARSEDDSNAAYDQVGPKYFSTIGIPILMGREITESDTAAAPRVAVINESLARFYFKDQNPIGRKIRLQGESQRDVPPYEIVGVSRDARDHGVRDKVERRFYVPFTQPLHGVNSLNFTIRTSAEPRTVMDSVRTRIRSIDSGLPVGGVDLVDTFAMRTVFAESMLARLSGLFGALALVLAAVGIYGLMSYLVVSRTKEIGIRMALGAQRSQILFSILRHSLLLTALGVAIGIPIAMLGTQALKAVLFGVPRVDILSLTAAVFMLAIVALSAGLIPARNATRVDPMVALRYE